MYGRGLRVIGISMDHEILYDKFTSGRNATERAIELALTEGARMVIVLTEQHPSYDRERVVVPAMIRGKFYIGE